MNKPNLFIVGAGKSGTTALYEYLRQHPQIYMSPTKEPHFFCTDFHVKHPYSNFSRFTDEKDYLSLFQEVTHESWIGEASPTYLSSQAAAVNMREFCPEARIIIMLRNPIEVLYASYYQWRFGQLEPLESFEAALEAQDARRQGKQIPNHGLIHPKLYQYFDNVNYPLHLQRYWDIFPKEQVHIIIYDDFKANTEAAVNTVFSFLELDPLDSLNLEAHNRSKTFRNPWLQRLLYQPPVWMVETGKLIKPLIQPVYQRLKSWNLQEENRPPMSTETEKALQERFKPEIEALSQMLNRDLSHWYRA